MTAPRPDGSQAARAMRLVGTLVLDKNVPAASPGGK